MSKPKYIYKETFIIRRISEDGLLKKFEGRYDENIFEESYDTEKEALDDIIKEEVDNAIILKRISKEMDWGE